MSGFLPDLASWALRGGAGDGNEEEQNGAEQNEGQEQAQEEVLTEAELRARRLARMEGLQKQQKEAQEKEKAEAMDTSDPMDVDPPPSKAAPQAQPPTPPPSIATSTASSSASKSEKKRKAKETGAATGASVNDTAKPTTAVSALSSEEKKAQKKKELLLKKVLLIRLVGSTFLPTSDSSCVDIDMEGDTSITAQSIAGILATRLALPVNASVLKTIPQQKPLILYLATCHKRSAEEMKTFKKQLLNNAPDTNATNDSKVKLTAEMIEILDSIKHQVVSYAASCLRIPELFPLGTNATIQLAKALLVSSTDLNNSITTGVIIPGSGITSKNSTQASFYHCLCEELVSEDFETFQTIISDIVQFYKINLLKFESILDGDTIITYGDDAKPATLIGDTTSSSTNPVVLVSALTALCVHKKAAEVLTSLPNFLLPTENTTEATEVIRPSMMNYLMGSGAGGAGAPGGAPGAPGGGGTNDLLRMLANAGGGAGGPGAAANNAENFITNYRPYLKRSGPALDKNTILGNCLKIGISTKNNGTNPAFSPTNILRQGYDTIERINNTQRTQLRTYQDVCNTFIFTLIKAGESCRTKVMKWFVDALLVNIGASALRPDPAKVSSTSTLLNATVALLKLCEPFMKDEKKFHLIDPAFVLSPNDHQGVYTTEGDDAVPRLGSTNNEPDTINEDANNNEQQEVDDELAAAIAMSIDTASEVSSPQQQQEDATTSSPNKKNVKIEYNPKNKFIPQCFFFTARFIHLGIVPLLSYHEHLLRHINHLHYELTSGNTGRDVASDPQFSILVAKQRTNEVALFQEELVVDTIRFCNLMGYVFLHNIKDDEILKQMPEHFVNNICDVLMSIAKMKPKLLGAGGAGHNINLNYGYTFKLVVKLLSSEYTKIIRNYNLRAMLGDVLYELYLPSGEERSRNSDVPISVATDDTLEGQPTYLKSDPIAQETLAPSLLLLYGEVEHTGYYDKMSHRAKIASLIKYLWESTEHKPAFRKITQNQESFIKFANGIMNESNTLIATIMQTLPEIREIQMKMKGTSAAGGQNNEWSRLSEEERNIITSRLDDHEREVKSALPLFNKTIQMFGYLNTDPDIRNLFLLDELCPRLVAMLLHVLTKLVGSKGMELKVDNPEQYEFKPKEMLRDLCAIFALFTDSKEFQIECARSSATPTANGTAQILDLLNTAIKTCKRLNLLVGESMAAFESLPISVEKELKNVNADEALYEDAPEEFRDELLDTFMKNPIILPSGHIVDLSTIKQQLLNDPIDPFNRKPMTLNDVTPATELKEKMDKWLEEKKGA